MPYAKRATKDKRKNLEYYVVVGIRRLLIDKNCPAEKSWPNHVKNEQHIGRPPAPQILNSQKTMMQRTANENTVGLYRGLSDIDVR